MWHSCLVRGDQCLLCVFYINSKSHTKVTKRSSGPERLRFGSPCRPSASRRRVRRCSFCPATECWWGCHLTGHSPAPYSLIEKSAIIVSTKGLKKTNRVRAIKKQQIKTLEISTYQLHTCSNSSERQGAGQGFFFHPFANGRVIVASSSRLTRGSVVTPAQEDELVWSLDTALFAVGSEGPDDTLKVSRFGDDHHLRIRHGGVIHNADAFGEALSGSRFRRFGGFALRLSRRRRIMLLKGQLSSSEDQGSPRALSHGHQLIENAPWCSLVFCTHTHKKTNANI